MLRTKGEEVCLKTYRCDIVVSLSGSSGINAEYGSSQVTMGWITYLSVVCLLFTYPSLSERCLEEIPLPTTFDILNDEYHLYGQYRINTTHSHYITFEVHRESYFRLYISGESSVDVDVYLRDESGDNYGYSYGANTEEMLSSKLPPNTYVIQFYPYRNTGEDSKPCPSMEMEVALSNVALVKERVRQYGRIVEKIPSVTVEELHEAIQNAQDFVYDSTVKNEQLALNLSSEQSPHWTFDISPKPGTNPQFILYTEIDFNFLTGGLMRLLLHSSNGTSSYPSCEDGCSYGRVGKKNSYTLELRLGPGSYTLWLYSLTGNLLEGISEVAPFSFFFELKQDHRQETYMSCDFLSLPSTLNSPGFIDSTGYMHFRDRILVGPSTSTTFVVPSPFFYRIRMELSSQVQVTHEIKANNRTIATGNERRLYLDGLANVQYTLSLSYSTVGTSEFCNSILFEMLTYPSTPEYTMDFCEGATVHNFPSIPSLLNLTSSVIIPPQSYRIKFDSSKSSTNTILFRYQISVQMDMSLEVELESKFLYGFEISLQQGGRPIRATTSRNKMVLKRTVYEGDTEEGLYLLLRWFTSSIAPLCGYYSFMLSIAPVDLAPQTCRKEMIPLDFSGPAYFGGSNRIHIQDEFLVPTSELGVLDRFNTINFTVRQKSLFRAVTDTLRLGGHEVDIKFELFENNVKVNHEVVAFTEEKLTYVAEPQKQYQFKVIFRALWGRLPECNYWNAELEIAPIHEASSTTCEEILLPQNLLFPSDKETTISQRYVFKQTSSPFVLNISLALPIHWFGSGVVYLRATIFYDFMWNDMSLRLLNSTDQIVGTGTNGFNKNEILPIRIANGFYTVQIVQSQALEVEELQHCSAFTFMMSVAPIPEDEAWLIGDELTCDVNRIPRTLR
eukprot:TRINITY_DN5720_c0_g2_i1.p1 TRINITY_DN5720_c0_g2~~TRINITY_DN5720_c0_g2_i1.p1  ORF type:complete len:898 (+),score=81.12 TRINITY_DN5720_c0_g2_i1:391-3084(+)